MSQTCWIAIVSQLSVVQLWQRVSEIDLLMGFDFSLLFFFFCFVFIRWTKINLLFFKKNVWCVTRQEIGSHTVRWGIYKYIYCIFQNSRYNKKIKVKRLENVWKLFFSLIFSFQKIIFYFRDLKIYLAIWNGQKIKIVLKNLICERNWKHAKRCF